MSIAWCCSTTSSGRRREITPGLDDFCRFCEEIRKGAAVSGSTTSSARRAGLSARIATRCAVKIITRDLNRPRVQILPGETLLEEFLRPGALTQVEAARRMGIPLNRLNEIVRGRRAITADTALRLAALFKMSPEFWMNLQASWDLHQARLAMKKAG